MPVPWILWDRIPSSISRFSSGSIEGQVEFVSQKFVLRIHGICFPKIPVKIGTDQRIYGTNGIFTYMHG